MRADKESGRWKRIFCSSQTMSSLSVIDIHRYGYPAHAGYPDVAALRGWAACLLETAGMRAGPANGVVGNTLDGRHGSCPGGCWDGNTVCPLHLAKTGCAAGSVRWRSTVETASGRGTVLASVVQGISSAWNIISMCRRRGQTRGRSRYNLHLLRHTALWLMAGAFPDP